MGWCEPQRGRAREADACALDIGKNGNDISGTLCGRMAGVTL
jgi:hypothetical protein